MRKFILGTDWWDDCDDAVALRLFTRFIKEDKVELSGICINGCMEHSVASLKGFLLADGIENVSIGIDRNATDFGGNPCYQKRLAKTYCPDVTNDDAEDGVRLYRRILASSETKIEIAEIGFLQVITNVLESGADDISEKSGLELFAEKVSKVWVMAGKWDVPQGLENNFCKNPRARKGAEAFCRLCPVSVTFLGFEIGNGVITGGTLPHNDHLYNVLSDYGVPNGRDSWDPMLVLLALTGDEEKAGYDTVSGTASVDAETGLNTFIKDENGRHKFVIKKHSDEYYQDKINNII